MVDLQRFESISFAYTSNQKESLVNRTAITTAIAGFALGMSLTSLVKEKQHTEEYKTATDAVAVTADVAKQYIEGYNKLNDYNQELYALATNFESAKAATEREKAAETLVQKIKIFNQQPSK